MKEFTLEELSKFNGKDGEKAYIAYNGNIYDLTGSSYWNDGLHMGMHEAGIDLTDEMGSAPHADDVFGEFQVIGTLAK